jgi:hypothetical protein
MRVNPSSLTAVIATMTLCTVALPGCDKSKSQAQQGVNLVTSVDPAQPAQQSPPTTEPATDPATQPAVAALLINRIFRQFPGAKLRLILADDHVTAVLYSADPVTAINDDYTGNSFYLRMPLNDVKDLASVNGAQWSFKSISSDRTDSTDGIFLNGLKHQLQPMNVIARFEGTGSTMRVTLAGEFLDFDNATPLLPGAITSVSGDLTADVDRQASP